MSEGCRLQQMLKVPKARKRSASLRLGVRQWHLWWANLLFLWQFQNPVAAGGGTPALPTRSCGTRDPAVSGMVWLSRASILPSTFPPRPDFAFPLRSPFAFFASKPQPPRRANACRRSFRRKVRKESDAKFAKAFTTAHLEMGPHASGGVGARPHLKANLLT